MCTVHRVIGWYCFGTHWVSDSVTDELLVLLILFHCCPVLILSVRPQRRFCSDFYVMFTIDEGRSDSCVQRNVRIGGINSSCGSAVSLLTKRVRGAWRDGVRLVRGSYFTAPAKTKLVSFRYIRSSCVLSRHLSCRHSRLAVTQICSWNARKFASVSNWYALCRRYFQSN
jgi:hypothetical protein